MCVIKYSSRGKVMIMCLLLKEANTLEHRGDGFVLIWNRAERDGAAVCVCVCVLVLVRG